MNQENLINYFNNQVDDIHSHLKIAGLSQSTELIHDLRVGIKRVRAFLFVLNLKKKNGKVKKILNKRIEKIFEKAGKLRNFQVYFEFVQEYEKLLKNEFYNFKEFISKKINRKRKTLKRVLAANEKNPLEILKAEVSESVISLSNEKINQRIEKYLSNIRTQFEKTSNRLIAKNLHQQRKLLKEFRFCVEMINNEPQESETDNQIVKIKEIEDILGRWHDYNELKKVVEGYVSKLKKSDIEQVIRMNALGEAISYDIVLLLDNYYKIMPEFNLNYTATPLN